MTIKSVSEINEYVRTSVNPLATPDQLFELYSVPSFDSDYPEIVSGAEIGSAKVTVEEGDVLICKINPRINRVWVVRHNTDYPLLASSEWIVVRSKNMNPHYLKWYFSSSSFRTLLTSQVTGIGGSLTRAQPKQVAKYPVPVPSRAEQDYIAGVLERIDELLLKQHQQTEKLDELVKSRFIELFGAITETVPLSYYIEALNAGKSLAGEEECPNKVLKTGATTYDYFDATQVKNLPDDYEPLEDHRIKTGDVIISRMNTAELVGAAAYVWEAPERTYLPDRLWKAEIKETACPIFIWQVLIQSSTKERIRQIASGTSGSMKNISKPGLLGIRVKKVDLAAQEQFAAFVAQTDKSKLAVQQGLKELEILKKSLMQQYFG